MITCLSTDGGIKKVPLYLKDELVRQGWKVVSPDVAADLEKKGINYLPEFDRTINIQTNMDYSRLNDSDKTIILEVDIL